MHSDYGIVWSCCVFSLKSISWNCQGPCRSNDSEDQARQKYKHPQQIAPPAKLFGTQSPSRVLVCKKIDHPAAICIYLQQLRVPPSGRKTRQKFVQALKYLKKGRYAHETVLFFIDILCHFRNY